MEDPSCQAHGNTVRRQRSYSASSSTNNSPLPDKNELDQDLYISKIDLESRVIEEKVRWKDMDLELDEEEEDLHIDRLVSRKFDC